MAGRKRNWNINTPNRYLAKALRSLEGVIPDEELRKDIAENQKESWQSGIEFYRKVKQWVKEVLDSEEYYVNPAFRAGYYAFICAYIKDTMFRGLNEDIVYAYLREKFKGIDENIVRGIMDRLKGQIGLPLPKALQRT